MFEDHTSIGCNDKWKAMSVQQMLVYCGNEHFCFVLLFFFFSLVIREMILWCSALICHRTDMRASISSQLFLIL